MAWMMFCVIAGLLFLALGGLYLIVLGDSPLSREVRHAIAEIVGFKNLRER